MKFKINKITKKKTLISNSESTKNSIRCVKCKNSIFSFNIFGSLKEVSQCAKIKGKYNFIEERTCSFYSHNNEWEKRLNFIQIFSEDVLKPY